MNGKASEATKYWEIRQRVWSLFNNVTLAAVQGILDIDPCVIQDIEIAPQPDGRVHLYVSATVTCDDPAIAALFSTNSRRLMASWINTFITVDRQKMRLTLYDPNWKFDIL